MGRDEGYARSAQEGTATRKSWAAPGAMTSATSALAIPSGARTKWAQPVAMAAVGMAAAAALAG